MGKLLIWCLLILLWPEKAAGAEAALTFSNGSSWSRCGELLRNQRGGLVIPHTTSLSPPSKRKSVSQCNYSLPSASAFPWRSHSEGGKQRNPAWIQFEIQKQPTRAQLPLSQHSRPIGSSSRARGCRLPPAAEVGHFWCCLSCSSLNVCAHMDPFDVLWMKE